MLKITKLLKGLRTDSAEDLKAFAEGLGISVDFDEIPKGEAGELDAKGMDELRTIAESAAAPGAKLFRVQVAKKGMPPIAGLIVLKVPVAVP